MPWTCLLCRRAGNYTQRIPVPGERMECGQTGRDVCDRCHDWLEMQYVAIEKRKQEMDKFYDA